MRITKYNVELDENCKTVLVKETTKNYPSVQGLTSPGEIKDMLDEVFRASYQAEEHTWLIAMTQDCKVIGVFEVSHGAVNVSILNPREIFVRLLLCGAASFVIAHNHPSGSATPSADDISTTQRIKEAAQLMGVSFCDHIIVGQGGLYSFWRDGILKPN